MQELLRDFRPIVLAVEENVIGSNRAKPRLHAAVSETKRIARSALSTGERVRWRFVYGGSGSHLDTRRASPEPVRVAVRELSESPRHPASARSAPSLWRLRV